MKRPRQSVREPDVRRTPAWQQYYEATRQPLYCLLLLFPLVAIYEFGTLMLRPVTLPGQQLVAQSAIQRLLGWFGASGSWLPAAVLLATLLGLHIASRRNWHIKLWVLPTMVLESVVLTLPLFVVVKLFLVAGGGGSDIRARIILAIGAGIYEELVFRMFAIGAIVYLLDVGLKARQHVSLSVAIGISALLFAACHFSPVGSNAPSWPQAIALCVAGVYLGLVYVGRGLGVAAGCHAAFNLITLFAR